jgi:iron(III) transport system substrate-binding protein
MKNLVVGALLFAPLAAHAQLTVYCSIIDEQCRAGVAAFERASGTKVTMVRKGTGEIYAQVRAESSNPRGDVWWGGPADPHMQAAEEGLLEEYRSPRLAELHPWAQRLAELSKFRVSGIYLGALGIGYNTEVLKKKGIPEPKCWADLLDAKFRDRVQIADSFLGGVLAPASEAACKAEKSSTRSKAARRS